MCGFVGIANYTKVAISLAQRTAFQNMLVADSARGMDGTGVIKISEDGIATWAKAAGNPFDLFRTPQFTSELWYPVTSGYTRWLIGHNRYKTKGDATNKNAHPFQHGHILLAHNGTLRGGSIPELNQFDVDSEAICKSISVRGIDETLKKIDSAYCFVYFDSKEKTLNMIRNKERPMIVGINKKTKIIAFGSEYAMVDWAMTRNLQYIAYDDYEELKENVLYTWTMDKLLPTTREVPGYEKPKKKSYKGGWVERDGIVVYEKVDQVKNTTSLAATSSENNYPEPTVYSGSYYKHTAMCACSECLKTFDEKQKNKGTSTAGLLQFPKASVVKTNNKMYATESYTTTTGQLQKGKLIHFYVDDWDELTKSSEDSSTEKAYQVTGYSPVYKDFIFKTRVKGKDGLDALVDADYVRGRIAAILVNVEPAESIGTVYISFPEPDWETTYVGSKATPTPLPDIEVPDSAFQKLVEGE